MNKAEGKGWILSGRRRAPPEGRYQKHWETDYAKRQQSDLEDEADNKYHYYQCGVGKWRGRKNGHSSCHHEMLSTWMGCGTKDTNDCINARRSNCGQGFKADLFYPRGIIRHLQSFRPSQATMLHVEKNQMYINNPSGPNGFRGSRHNNFQVQWKGYLNIKRGGFYFFWLESDDGSKLSLNGVLFIDNDGLHGMKTKLGVAPLRSGYFRVNVEAFDHEGNFGCILKYKGPDTGGRKVLVGGDAVSQNRACATTAWKPGSFMR